MLRFGLRSPQNSPLPVRLQTMVIKGVENLIPSPKVTHVLFYGFIMNAKWLFSCLCLSRTKEICWSRGTWGIFLFFLPPGDLIIKCKSRSNKRFPEFRSVESSGKKQKWIAGHFSHGITSKAGWIRGCCCMEKDLWPIFSSIFASIFAFCVKSFLRNMKNATYKEIFKGNFKPEGKYTGRSDVWNIFSGK